MRKARRKRMTKGSASFSENLYGTHVGISGIMKKLSVPGKVDSTSVSNLLP